jgi:dTDP-4-amino-4,6-dideoxygalactose transaminase|tara:strand:+ start:82 stop:681 length:600 start_codon:yes stop_codon:yes gene_type:complete
MNNPFDTVRDFEDKLANHFGSRFCVATDSCTHAVELCMRQQQVRTTSCPKHTYLSIPMTLKKLELDWHFVDDQWQEFYEFGTTGIYDAATFWSKGKYIPQSMMCLSFQFRKTLSLGRGGAILLDDYDAAVDLRRMAYDSRYRDSSWEDQIASITQIGYHYYMTPETAQMGLDKFPSMNHVTGWTWNDYPDVSKAPLFNE